MNTATKTLIEQLALGVAVEKAWSGAPMPKAEFDRLCETVAMELERAVEAVLNGKVAGPTAKPKRAPRKAAEATGGRGQLGIPVEALRAFFLGGGHSPLQQIAERFSVSKGVAERAVKALPGVKSGPGTKAAGQRGKAPTVFWLE